MIYQRIPYDECPLCDCERFSPLLRANVTQHALWTEEFDPEMIWVKCSECEHVFTEGYFGQLTLANSFFGKENPYPHSMEVQRLLNSRVVERIDDDFDRGSTWLDVGCGSGSLVMTAGEFGFRATGIDLRLSSVEAAQAMGLNVIYSSAREENLRSVKYDVVSLCDVLEHVARPRDLLHEVVHLVKPGGVLLVSCPNLDAFKCVADAENPYWWELEHFHNFTRKSLTKLVCEEGFRVQSYHVSERYRLGMEVYFEKSIPA